MDRDALSLGHQLAVAIQKSCGEVAAGVQYLGHSRPEHNFGHLAGDGLQPMLHNSQGNRVGSGSNYLWRIFSIQTDLQLDATV